MSESDPPAPVKPPRLPSDLAAAIAARDPWVATRLYAEALTARGNLAHDHPDMRAVAQRQLADIELWTLNGAGYEVSRLVEEAFSIEPGLAARELEALCAAYPGDGARHSRIPWLDELAEDLLGPYQGPDGDEDDWSLADDESPPAESPEHEVTEQSGPDHAPDMG